MFIQVLKHTITKMSQKSWNILVSHASLPRVYHMTEAVQTLVVDSIVVASALTHCALLQSKYGLISEPTNGKLGQIPEFMLYELELEHCSKQFLKPFAHCSAHLFFVAQRTMA